MKEIETRTRSLNPSIGIAALALALTAAPGCFAKKDAVDASGPKLQGIGKAGNPSNGDSDGSAPTIGSPDLERLSMGVGARDFGQINQTMAALTGIDPRNQTARNTFNAVSASLPTTSALMSVSGPHVVAITRLAAQYCDLVASTNDANRQAVFGLTATEFGTATSNAGFRAIGDKAIKALLTRFNRETAPSPQDVATLTQLLNELIVARPNGGTATVSANGIMVSLCTAALGSVKAVVAI
jgi:hypothetical protein